MLTYSLYNTTISSTKGKTWDQLTTPEKISTIGVIIIILAFIIWAWVRAIKCSSSNPDSRAVHLLFASADPILYLIFSYFIEGMCN